MKHKDLYDYLDNTAPIEYLITIDFRSAYFKPLVRHITNKQKEVGIPNGLLNVAIDYTFLRKGHVGVEELNAIISFLRKKCATDAESAINIIREANLKRK